MWTHGCMNGQALGLTMLPEKPFSQMGYKEFKSVTFAGEVMLSPRSM